MHQSAISTARITGMRSDDASETGVLKFQSFETRARNTLNDVRMQDIKHGDTIAEYRSNYCIPTK